MSRALVTGASGFIGEHTVPALEERGFEVIAARGDLLAPGVPERIVADARPTHLVHLAWHTEHGEYWESRPTTTISRPPSPCSTPSRAAAAGAP